MQSNPGVKITSCLRMVLDTNIWDKINTDNVMQEKMAQLINEKKLIIIVPAKVETELLASPFGSVPDFFPVEKVPDSMVWGHSTWGGMRWGEGKIRAQHQGHSNKASDAIIADTTDFKDAKLVSEDRRTIKRFMEIKDSSKAMNYSSFRQLVMNHP